VLTDYEYKILNILRPRVQGEEKFLVRETYPVELAREITVPPNAEKIIDFLSSSRPSDTLKTALVSHFELGPPFLEHLLLNAGLKPTAKVNSLDKDKVAEEVAKLFYDSQSQLDKHSPAGFIVQKKQLRPRADGSEEEFISYSEFHPYALKQNEGRPHTQYGTFDEAVDEFFSKV